MHWVHQEYNNMHQVVLEWFGVEHCERLKNARHIR